MIKKSNIRFIDLDLPSGTLWGDRNLGNNRYFLFGDLTSINKKELIINDPDLHYLLEKFDGNDKLLSKYDISTVKLGKDCKTPSEKDFKELIYNTHRKWDKIRYGRVLTSIINGKSLFFPALGYFSLDICSKDYVYKFGNYWTSSACTWGNDIGLYFFAFNSGSIWTTLSYKQFGFNIRPIKKRD